MSLKGLFCLNEDKKGLDSVIRIDDFLFDNGILRLQFCVKKGNFRVRIVYKSRQFSIHSALWSSIYMTDVAWSQNICYIFLADFLDDCINENQYSMYLC